MILLLAGPFASSINFFHALSALFWILIILAYYTFSESPQSHPCIVSLYHKFPHFSFSILFCFVYMRFLLSVFVSFALYTFFQISLTLLLSLASSALSVFLCPFILYFVLYDFFPVLMIFFRALLFVRSFLSCFIRFLPSFYDSFYSVHFLLFVHFYLVLYDSSSVFMIFFFACCIIPETLN